jgi:hypothetical protein
MGPSHVKNMEDFIAKTSVRGNEEVGKKAWAEFKMMLTKKLGNKITDLRRSASKRQRKEITS